MCSSLCDVRCVAYLVYLAYRMHLMYVVCSVLQVVYIVRGAVCVVRVACL